MSKHSFMDSILNRPSQRYTEPLDAKSSSRKPRYQTPSDLPNPPNRPDSILAGNMFKAAGAGSLHQNGQTYSQTPSVMSGRSNTSRFSLFRKKGRQPSISGGSVYYDGNSSVAQTDVGASPRKGRWWESGGLTRNNYSSRPPSVAGSIFSEPDAAAVPSAYPAVTGSLRGTAPPRTARSDYGGPTSSRNRYSSQPTAPPLPPLATKASMSSMRRQSGVAPLGQQQHNLMHQASSPAMARSPSISQSNVDLTRPVSPAASMGRTRSPSRAAANGSSDWNSFVKSMSGTEVAKIWETMPTLAPKPSRTSEKRSSVVASRVRKELEQEAQFQQVQRDPGIVHQDLLARAASQVIGEMPPTPVSPLSEPQLAPAMHLQPGQVVAPISPVYSPVASNSSLNVAQQPILMSPQASAVLYGTAAPAPVTLPQAVPMVPVIPSPQPQQHLVHPQLAPQQVLQQQPLPQQLVPQQYVEPVPTSGLPPGFVAVPATISAAAAAAVPAAVSQQSVPVPLPAQVPVAAPASSPLAQDSPAQTFAPLAVPTRRAAPQPVDSAQLSAPAQTLPSAAAPPLVIPSPVDSSAAAVQAPPTTAQYLADRVEQQESADQHALPEEQDTSPEESDESEDTSSDEGLVGGGQPTLDAVAEEEEEGSSVGHTYHHEMRKRDSVKGKGPSRNYDDFEARMHRRQASTQSQPDDSRDDETPVAPSGVHIQVTEPPTQDLPLAPQAEAPRAEPALKQAAFVAAPQLIAPERPQLVSRTSEYSDYQSATSGASTPTTRERLGDQETQDDEAAVASIAQVQLPSEAAEHGAAADDTASIAPSLRPSMRTSRSSRPGTVQRRLSEVSLGTSFAVSGILRRPASSRRFTGDGDSDSGAELSDDDAELRAKALAEQDRLRKMNVGDDFFGPSLSTMLDKFDRFSYSDSTVNKLKREPEQPSKAVAATPATNGVDAEAQQAINDVRQKRADAVADSKRRNSADTAGLAPSFAAVWLLNQAQGSSDSAAARALPEEEEGDQTITASTLPTSASKDLSITGASPEKAKESVLNRPRPKSKRPQETGGVSISEGRLEADKPQAPVQVEDTRSTLPISPSQHSMQSAGATVSSPQSKQTTPENSSPIVASKDKPAPAKSAMKPKPSRSLADTLFGLSFRSPSKDKKKDKKDKKDKSKHSRKVSVDSIGSGSTKSDRSSIVESTTNRSSTDTAAARSAVATPNASVPPSPSAKALGKQRMADDVGMAPSETFNHFATPLQSMANLQGAAGAEASPEKFHTAHDLKALADTAIPAYPTDLNSVPSMPNGAAAAAAAAADARPEHQRKLSEQIKSMDGFGSFALPQLEQREVAPPIASAPAVNSNGVATGTGSLPIPASQLESVSETSVSAGDSTAPSSSEPSVTSTIPTSPESELASKAAPQNTSVVTEVAASEPATAISSSHPLDVSERRLPMPPPPAVEEVMAPAHEDRTPTGKPEAIPGVGINLIPPTPPAIESRNSFTSSQVPGTPTIDEHDEYATPQRPPLMSRSSSKRTAMRSDSKVDSPSESLSRSKSMAPAKKGLWQEYKGKGLSLPPGLVATTIASSQPRRMSTQDKKPTSSQPAGIPTSRADKVQTDRALPALPVEPVVGQIVATAPPSVLESPPRHSRATSSPSPKSKRSNGSLSPLAQSPTMNRLMADAPPVPQIPTGYQTTASVSSSSSRLYAHSVASSEQAWESRSASPAPSAVPSQSARSVGSHVSSSVHSTSYRNSPRAEYSYVNHHELSPYAKKMRSLSPSPAVPTLSQTGNRHSLMSAINEWESQVPETAEAAGSLSPYPSRPTSPSPYPTLPASTVSRGSSVISSISSSAVVRNAPLGASTNQYLHPPIPRSRMSVDSLSAVSESAIESLNPPSVVGHPSGPSSVSSSSPSASQSALSLASTLPTSMPTVPTSYRPNKDPKRFSTNADDLLNNRTIMQTIAVTSGAFASRSKSVVKRKKSADLNGDRRTSADVPDHLQDELSLTTLSMTAHTPPPRKIGSHQVLVQVIAVAIDETDKLLLREKVRAENAFGFVPGRSFCGRIVECGYEVKKMRKGDVVFGLQDSRKSGALAEFMVIDYNRVCHAPSDCLTTEQIAALPSAGVMAHQLIQNHCRQLPRGARVLILNAHDGVGLLTMQESVGLGLLIVAQCPPSISDGVAVCQANGAHEVVIGEPLWAINSLHESSFDLIVDTVGGRKVYDASRRILAFDGQFCTCFGDEHGTANPNLKSHLRSLRRAFFKKDRKNIGYEWVGVDSAEDCKEALDAVKRAAEQGSVCPRLRSVLPFADASRAFDPTSRNVNDEPGAIVVRVS
ncbi:uncharacterized protein SRS1_10341 [Sporisorium reilianum f. sp. reilianum]|uniref:Enoyl reductase (ER) domain-containing protein n=1 Tax=Sporisorium reilianum f. sp. reilianum TaxID=72559 RepID=A0A2N8U9E0_9BASI|nr:uncharacterized protein SRS1_10341 [Sporisorium reilianum f. sp. reilianum]